MNQVTLVGNLTQDIEVKKTANGKSYVQFSVAVDDGKDSKGQKKTQFIRCVAWEKTADAMGTYCKKGNRIGVIGRIVNSSYEDPKIPDRRIFTTDVVVSSLEFMTSKKENESGNTDSEDVPY